MSDPYRIPEPFVVSFSGGRTSGFMLWNILQAYGGKLPPAGRAIFCNTGKEADGTLDFVHRCSQEWGVEIVWLEFRSRANLGFARVDYETASRNGEPFELLIRTKQHLPNIMYRFCTQWLKVLTAHRYIRHVLGWDEYTSAIGMRADELRRVAKLALSEQTPGEEPIAPLAKAGATLADVRAFWCRQPFDLKIDAEEGNCDACFLKGVGQRASVFRKRPEAADWWLRQEEWVSEKAGAPARFDKRFPIATLAIRAAELGPELFPDEESFPDCRCTD